MKDCGSVLVDGVEDHKKKRKKNRNLITAHVRKSVYRTTLIWLVLFETQGKKVPVLKQFSWFSSSLSVFV